MSLELIMVEGGEIAHGAGSTISGGTFTVTSTPSAAVKAEGGAVYRGDLLYSFTGGVAGSVTGVATIVPQTISPLAIKCLADGLPVVRESDSGVMSAQGVDASGATVPVSGPVEVPVAGQTSVKGA